MENISHPRTKNYDSPLLSNRNASRRQSGKMTHRGLKKKHHRMTPIEHLLIDIIQIIFRYWIENRMADFWYFSADIAQFFYKRWRIIFFYGRGSSFVLCCRKNLQCRSARFFRSSTTEVVFSPTPTCFHLLGRENISEPRKKILIRRYWSKKILADVGQERWPIEV